MKTFKPSLRAAFERGLVALGAVTGFFVPLIIGSILGSDDPTGPAIFAALEIVGSLIIPVLVSFAPAVQLLFTRYTMDDEGLREEVSILSRTQRRVTWDKVTALRHRRTVLDRVLGIERLDVIAYGERGATIHLIGLRDAAALRNDVAQRMRQHADIGRLLSND